MSVPQIIPECVWRDDAIVGESPVWCAATQVLYWVDIRRQKIQRFDPATGTNTFVKIDDIVTSVNQRKNGGFVLTLRNQFAFFDVVDIDIQRVIALWAYY